MLQEFRQNLRPKTAQEIVKESAAWARFLFDCIEDDYLDRERAIHAIARRAEVPVSTLKTLIDRPQALKKVCGSIWFNLGLEFEAAKAARDRKLERMRPSRPSALVQGAAA